MFRNVDVKPPAAIVAEWDALAPIRLRQITSGADISYREVIAPSILALASKEAPGIGLDAGCGIGYFTDLLAEKVGEVIGVDPSIESIAIARAHYGKRAAFHVATLEDYSAQNTCSADLVVTNMVLMDVVDLDSFLGAAYRVLRPGGALAFSTTHPCFWPSYYGYAHEPWYRYNQQLIVESPFRITAQPDCPLLSTHVHRPLNAYVQAFRKSLLSIEILSEPMPSADVEAHYPEPWKYPRYLVGLCRR
jgi:predicted TPR repeat methyltransferase